MPPFRDLLKSRAVEDPVNILVHRPLAYLFAWLVFPTPMTPNMVTFLAMGVGVTAGYFILVGTKTAMMVGGLLLWASAILDGADGILARAKHMSSPFGRALDGAADAIVAICTVFPVFYHLWQQHHDPVHLWVMLPAIVSANIHHALHDYYKETYLHSTRPGHHEEGERPAQVEKRLEEAKDRGVLSYLAVKHIMLPQAKSQFAMVRFIDPTANRERISFETTEESGALFKRYNVGPMQLWNLLSTAPHSYLMAICIIFDRAEIYLWIRLIGMNVVLLLAVLWQRHATAKTHDRLIEMGAYVVHTDPVG